MQNYRSGKWANRLLSLQRADGSWGCFHSLSGKNGAASVTTEQALVRLELLGYTDADECIRKAIAHMESLLLTKTLPEGNEKTSDFETFVDLIAAARIRRFTLQSRAANAVAESWAKVLTAAFRGGAYSHSEYEKCYRQTFGRRPKGGRLADFVNFYPISLLAGMLDGPTEMRMLDYVLAHEAGIYYIYAGRLDHLPEAFQSRQASRYLAAIELLCRYKHGKDKVAFALEWLKSHQAADGTWDMGAPARDGVYFPLSDRWTSRTSVIDSTHRIGKLFSMPCFCGHDCSRCVTYIATQRNDDALRRRSQSFYRDAFHVDLPVEKFACNGGRSDCVFALCKECPFAMCCRAHKIESCGECPDFPCEAISQYRAQYVNRSNQL